MTTQTLMIDADDTLWQNNIHFEAAIDNFIALVNHPAMSPGQVRAAFDALEHTRVQVHGYGADAFHQSMLAGFAHLTGAPCSAAHAEEIAAYAGSVRHANIELLDGVAEMLPLLSARHRLILVTKGAHDEQTAKLDRSGLAQYFFAVEVLREKHAAAYRGLLDRYRCEPAATWMIGNSPRSDVNPALAAGMHAVYLPHPSTWSLEVEPLASPAAGQHLLQLDRFADLAGHF